VQNLDPARKPQTTRPRDIIDPWDELLINVSITKEKGRWEDTSRWKETEETGQPHRLDLGQKLKLKNENLNFNI
jgi:hypothetical protein